MFQQRSSMDTLGKSVGGRTTAWLIALACTAFALLLTEPAMAVTRVFLQNNTDSAIDVKVSRSGHGLAKDKWRALRGQVKAGERAEIVWFNRDSGIKNGKDFYFTEKVAFDGGSIDLKQRLKGSLVGSHMWQSLSGDKWFDDRKTHTGSFKTKDGTIRVKYRAFFTGTDDNIEYILQSEYDAPPGGANSFNVLAYNVYLRPTSLFKNGQSKRAGLLPAALDGYDAIILSEVFDDDARKKLVSGLKSKGYNHATRVVGKDRGIEQDGGVMIVSRHPIVAQDQRRFGKVCKGTDCMSDKGVIYAKIKKQGQHYHVFGSHTQAWPDKANAAVRDRQLELIRRFINDKKIPAAEPVLIGGDLNVNLRTEGEYKQMLKTLNATQPERRGHGFTFDPTVNKLASAGPREYLDYVLFANDHKKPKRAFNEVRMLRSKEEWKEFFFEKAMWDLSDHFPVLGSFQF